MNSGLSDEIIEEVQQVLGCILPEPLLELYQTLDGTTESSDWVEMRLMSLNEVVNFHQVVQDEEEEWGGFAAKGVRVFWSDDNSNFTGLYVAGRLKEKLCFIDHEEVDLSPVFASVQSFRHAMKAASPKDLRWSEVRRDYPVGPSVDPQTSLQDWEISQAFRPLYEASQGRDRVYYAWCMMALTPYEQTASLLAFTYDNDMYIQERACEILGLRQYEAAIERLAEVARNGMQNGRIASIVALGKISSDAARSHLLQLLPLLPEGYGIYIKGALKGP